jgi:xylulokinase
MGVRPDSMLLTGGGARSPFWRQMLADVFACPVTTTINTEGPALGVAILAGVGAGIYPSVQEACDKMIHIGETLQPEPIRSQQYAACHRLYDSLYPALQDSFKQLRTLA